MANKAVCFHHNDTDGHCSGAIVRHFVKDKGFLKDEEVEDVKCVELDYRFAPKVVLDNIDKDTIVFITDFAFGLDLMDQVVEIAKKVIWIDHHIGSIERLKKYEQLAGLRDVEHSASLLAWVWFNEQTKEKTGEGKKDEDVIIPPAIKLVNDYDTWNHDPEGQAVTFEMGISIIDTDPSKEDSMDFWTSLFEVPEIVDPTDPEEIRARFKWDTIMQVMNLGGVVVTYKNNRDSYIMKKSFVANIPTKDGDVPALVFNGHLSDSYSFDYAPDTLNAPDVKCWYYFNGKNYKYSLRSVTTDVRKIAEQYGGGGHTNSCSFIISENIFHPEQTETNADDSAKKE